MNLKNTSFCIVAGILSLATNLAFGASPQSQSPSLIISSTISSIFNVPTQFPDPSNTQPILDLEQHPENNINKTITISYAPSSTTTTPSNFDVSSNSDQEISIVQTGNAWLQRKANDAANNIPFQIKYIPCNANEQQAINVNTSCNTSSGCQIPANYTTWTACNTGSHGYIIYQLSTPNKILPPGDYSVAPGYSVTFQASF